MADTTLTSMQTLLGTILTNRIKAELAKTTQDFTMIKDSIYILLAGGEITPTQYNELTALMPAA